MSDRLPDDGFDASAAPPEFIALLEALCAGQAGEDERRRIEVLMAERPELRAVYLDCMQLHAHLRWEMRAQRALTADVVANAEPATAPVATIRPGRVRVAAIALAAAVLIGAAAVGVYVATSGGGAVEPISPPSVGSVIAGSAMAVRGPVHNGEPIGAGPLTVGDTEVELLLRSSATVTAGAGTRLELMGPMRVALREGRAVFDCPPQASGFTVDLPHGAQVIDLGTRFAVTATADDRAVVTVYTGRVDVVTGDGSTRALTEGRAVRLDRGAVTDEFAALPPGVLLALAFDDASAAGSDTDPTTQASSASGADLRARLIGGATIAPAGDAVPGLWTVNGGALALPDSAGAWPRVEAPSAGLEALDGGPIRIEAWVKLDLPQRADRAPLIQCKPLGAGDEALAFQVLVRAGTTGDAPHPGALAFGFGDGDRAHFVFGTLAITNDRWHRVAVTHDPAARTVRFELDDADETVSAPDAARAPIAGPLVIGAHSNRTGGFDARLVGAIDELRIGRPDPPAEPARNDESTHDKENPHE